MNRERGLVSFDQLEEGMSVFSPWLANQAVAFAKISRSLCN
jgi:hypothetical protein